MGISGGEKRVLLVFGIIVAIGVAIGYFILDEERRLPVFQPADINSELVDESIREQRENHHVLPFQLTDQFGRTITLDSLKGRIFVADFFFTTCPDICKDMAEQKRRLQDEMRDDPNFAIVSHSVTPEIDSVEVMHAYGERQGAIKGRWYLLTGEKTEIYRLARKSYFAVVDGGGDGGPYDFIHTENFVLVDPLGQLRGFYDGTSADDVDRLISDIAVLRMEFPVNEGE